MQISSLPGLKKKAIWFKWKQNCHYAWVRFFYKIKSVQKCVSAWFSVQTSFRCKASSFKKREREGRGGVWYLGLPCGVMQSRSLSLSHFLTSHFTTSTQRIELYAAAVLPSGLFFFLSFFLLHDVDPELTIWIRHADEANYRT